MMQPQKAEKIKKIGEKLDQTRFNQRNEKIIVELLDPQSLSSPN